MFLNSDAVLYAGLTEVMRRGTAEIYEYNENGVFLRDTVSGVLMLAADDFEIAAAWLIKYEHLKYRLMVVFLPELIPLIKNRYGLTETLDCFQAAYLLPNPPKLPHTLRIENAKDCDLGMILSHYDTLTEEELKAIIQRKDLFIGYHHNDIVGFVGQHLEGSMGILEVLPQYRRSGYGTELEIFMIHHMMERHLLPFCQVVAGNEKSLRLQKKLGLTFSKKHVYWIF